MRITQEDIEMERELNLKALGVIGKIKDLDIPSELKEEIQLIAETVMEDTARRIAKGADCIE